jgi:hypothetical protein
MFLDYSNFINEAKIGDFEIGSKVLFNGKYDLSRYGADKVKLDGKIGTVIDIKKEVIVFEVEDAPKSYYIKKGKVKLSKYQLKNVEIFTDEKLEEWKKQNAEKAAKEDELERKLNAGELYKFQATKDFLKILKEIKFKKKGEYFDVSYFDIVKDSADNISFVPAKKVALADKSYEDIEKFRQQTKVGRLLRKLNPDLKDPEIEEFSNKYKAEYEANQKGGELRVVTGDDISYWYQEKRYKKGGGTLNNSCMRYDSTQYRVKFYDLYPDQIAMATYIKKNKLLARALIWRLDDGRVYMDRIYSSDGAARVQLENYANKNNMLMYKNIGKKYPHEKLIVTLVSPTNDPKNFNLPYTDSFHVIPNYYNYSKNYKKDKKTGLYSTPFVCNY